MEEPLPVRAGHVLMIKERSELVSVLQGRAALVSRRMHGGWAAVAFCTVTLINGAVTLAQDQRSSDTAPMTQGARVSSTQQFETAGVKVLLQFLDTDFRHGTPQLVGWIERSIDTVARYYGRFPGLQLRIRVAPVEGRGVHHGTAFGSSVPLIRLQVGRDVTAAELNDDWILVHEMVHLALPDVGSTHAWLSEGLATYVEGIARAQAGDRTPADVWAEHVRSMPRGLPQKGDRGLDHTHTWGRTYWGGALFCLLADVEIRSRTGNRFGLQHALRSVLKSSGGLVSDWPVARVFETGDAAVGTHVLQDLYAQMKDKPVEPDLAALWQRLGIERDGTSVALRDDAPLAAVRDAIMKEPRR